MSVLTEVRTRLADLNVCELQVAEVQPALTSMWKEIQECKMEMNHAILEAVNITTTRYKNRIEELEKKYAFLLRMSA